MAPAHPVSQADMDTEAMTQAIYGMFANVAFMIITNQFIKYFNLTDPSYLLFVRVGYAATQAAIVMFLLFLKMKIQSQAPTSGQVEVIEPPAAAGQPPTKRKMTPKEYDLLEANKQLKGTMSSVLFSVALHYFFKSSHMLIIGSVNAIRALLTSPLVKLYFFKYKAEANLARPFKEPPSPFGELFKQLLSPEHSKKQKVPVRPTKKDHKSDSEEDDDDEPIKVVEEKVVATSSEASTSEAEASGGSSSKNVKSRNMKKK